jgi:hypothetical protein
MKSIDNFSYIISAVLTPLFLVAGTFFPIDALPEWARVAAQFNPLHHLVDLVRDAVFGFKGWVDLLHVGVLALFALHHLAAVDPLDEPAARRLARQELGRARAAGRARRACGAGACSSASRSATRPSARSRRGAGPG